MKPLDAVTALSNYREGETRPVFIVAAVVMEGGHVIISQGNTLESRPNIQGALADLLARTLNLEVKPETTEMRQLRCKS